MTTGAGIRRHVRRGHSFVRVLKLSKDCERVESTHLALDFGDQR